MKDKICIITEEPKPVQAGSVPLVFISDSLGIHVNGNLIFTRVGKMYPNVQELVCVQPDVGRTLNRLWV